MHVGAFAGPSPPSLLGPLAPPRIRAALCSSFQLHSDGVLDEKSRAHTPGGRVHFICSYLALNPSYFTTTTHTRTTPTALALLHMRALYY